MFLRFGSPGSSIISLHEFSHSEIVVLFLDCPFLPLMNDVLLYCEFKVKPNGTISHQ